MQITSQNDYLDSQMARIRRRFLSYCWNMKYFSITVRYEYIIRLLFKDRRELFFEHICLFCIVGNFTISHWQWVYTIDNISFVPHIFLITYSLPSTNPFCCQCNAPPTSLASLPSRTLVSLLLWWKPSNLYTSLSPQKVIHFFHETQTLSITPHI